MLLFLIPPDDCWDFFSLFLDIFLSLLQMCCVCFRTDEAIPVHCVESSLHKLFPLFLEGSVENVIRERSALFLCRTLMFLCCYSVFTQVYWSSSVNWEGLFCSVSSPQPVPSGIIITLFNQQNFFTYSWLTWSTLYHHSVVGSTVPPQTCLVLMLSTDSQLCVVCSKFLVWNPIWNLSFGGSLTLQLFLSVWFLISVP